MVDSPSVRDCQVEVELSLKRFEGSSRVQSVDVSTRTDGTVTISSIGHAPRLTLRQVSQLRRALNLLAKSASQDIVIEHDGRTLAELNVQTKNPAKWKFHWWSILKQWFQSR